jgi:phosphohistidine phosphatase
MRDPARPLSETGRAELQTVAKYLAAQAQAADIVHSGKTRAEQSAQILHTALPNASVQMRPGLNPNDDVHALADDLQHETQDLVVVGHLPYVSRLTSLLICGDADRSVFMFDTGSCVALQRHGDTWCVRWMLDPHLL